VEDWRDKFLLGAENALRSRPRDEAALREEEIKRLGVLVLGLGVLKTAAKLRPTEPGTLEP